GPGGNWALTEDPATPSNTAKTIVEIERAIIRSLDISYCPESPRAWQTHGCCWQRFSESWSFSMTKLKGALRLELYELGIQPSAQRTVVGTGRDRFERELDRLRASSASAAQQRRARQTVSSSDRKSAR